MPRYLSSFDDGSMDHFAHADLPSVGEAAHAVLRQGKAAGVWIFGGGLLRQQAAIVATDGAVSAGSVPEPKAVLDGFSTTVHRPGRPGWQRPAGARRRCARSCSMRTLERSRRRRASGQIPLVTTVCRSGHR